MNHYLHYLSGFFEYHDQAKDVFNKLAAQGLPVEHMRIYSKSAPLPLHESTESSNEVLKDVLVDGTIGTAVGTGIGALIQVALIASNVTLFVASPLIAPLVLLGWGAGIGGVVGASIGAADTTRPLSALVEDAIKNGQFVLVVETRSAEETDIAQKIFKEAIGDYKDVNAA